MATHIALSFDDGRLDNLAVINNGLIPRNIPVTLFVTTGYIDGSCPQEKTPTQTKALSKDDVVSLSKESCVELGLHGDMHLNEEWDIEAGRQKMLNWIPYPETHVFGFASPRTSFPIQQFTHSDSVLFTEHISYLAMGLRIQSLPHIRVFARKIGRILHIPLLFRIAYADTLMTDCPDRIVYRVPIHRDTTFAQVKALIDTAIRRSASVTLMFHSIEKRTGDTWTWSADQFYKLCDYLTHLREEGLLELVTVQELVNDLRTEK